MDMVVFLKFLAALIFVLSLMGLLSFALKRIKPSGFSSKSGRRRIEIIEVLPLDVRRRAVLLRRDDTEHLVILSSSGETVVETQIKRSQSDAALPPVGGVLS